MASYAPFHLQSVFLINGWHVVDLAVARRTSDTLCNVNAVIEICKFGQIVNAFPLDRFVVSEARSNRFKIFAVGPQLAVAIHTRLCGRHAGTRRGFDGRMAIAAVDAVVADVVFMAELNRLLFFQISAGQIR